MLLASMLGRKYRSVNPMLLMYGVHCLLSLKEARMIIGAWVARQMHMMMSMHVKRLQ